MRSMFLSLCVAAFAAFFVQSAEPPAKPMSPDEAKAKVAVAMAIHKARAAAIIRAGSCGSCRTDYAESRADAVAKQIPLVLFVGDCRGNGEAVVEAGGIPCRVAEYANEPGKPADECRIVVLKPKPVGSTGSEFWLVDTLPHDATGAALKTATTKAANSKPPAAPAVPGPMKINFRDECQCGVKCPCVAAVDEPLPPATETAATVPPANKPAAPVYMAPNGAYYYFTTPATNTCESCRQK